SGVSPAGPDDGLRGGPPGRRGRGPLCSGGSRGSKSSKKSSSMSVSRSVMPPGRASAHSSPSFDSKRSLSCRGQEGGHRMSEAAATLSSRELVLGRYRPIRPLGSGGAGSVWLVLDEKTGREVALKIVSREGTGGPRAEREATAAAQLRHERCLRAYALARDSQHVYIAYEYVPGRTLRQAMRDGE